MKTNENQRKVMKTEIKIQCKCGEVLLIPAIPPAMYFGTFNYKMFCPRKKWFNFWKHY